MAPTEILAQQHLETFTEFFEGTGIRIRLLTSGLPAAQRREVLEGLAEGSVDVVFWTRAWSEGTVKTGLKSMNEEEFEAFKQELETEQTEEETAIMKSLHGALSRTEYEQRDMPEGTVITVPYYTDCNVLVVLK